MNFLTQFLKNFFTLFLLLIIVKFFLVLYRMTTRKWPKSIHYLISIVEWEKEGMKLGALAIVAALITILTFKR